MFMVASVMHKAKFSGQTRERLRGKESRLTDRQRDFRSYGE